MDRIAGIATFSVQGRAVTFEGKLQYQAVSTEREEKMAGDGTIAGYKEKGVAPYMSLTMFSNNPGMSSSQLFAMQDVTLVAELANGGTVTGHSMNMMKAPEPDNDEGTMECRWIGFVDEDLG